MELAERASKIKETVLRDDDDDPALTATAEWVADVVRQKIIRGDLTARDRIVERKLSRELNVSRTPIREALKLLRADGLIEISRNRGAQVTEYSEQEALDLFDVIASLEGLAAKRLAATITMPVLDRLEQMHERMLSEYRSGNVNEYFDANSEIHDVVVAECGNPVLADSHRRLIVRARRGRFLAIMDKGRWAQAVEEHETLMDVLRSRDADAALAIWNTHLRNTGETVAALLNVVKD